MRKKIEIPGNVWEFLDRAAADAGRIEADRFGQDMHSMIVEGHGIASPIEQMFYIALRVMARANFVEINPESVDGKTLGFGVYVTPQAGVGNYRLDFLCERTNFYGQKVNAVGVELDGHDFHDRDKAQRSYEKARDRFFAREGLILLHYTGSDLVADPYRVAHEVLDTLEINGPIGTQASYDKSNPFGIE